VCLRPGNKPTAQRQPANKHRPGVTIAVQALEKAGLITARRSHITIVDRKGLEKSSNGIYVQPED
jgi:hypothetical protein